MSLRDFLRKISEASAGFWDLSRLCPGILSGCSPEPGEPSGCSSGPEHPPEPVAADVQAGFRLKMYCRAKVIV